MTGDEYEYAKWIVSGILILRHPACVVVVAEDAEEACRLAEAGEWAETPSYDNTGDGDFVADGPASAEREE